ncbi:hypothetical protein U4E84_04185 [Halorubrum sp. AD140]|uniref:hypothetical protein n=1 Tax=Halorubrum sp. AD140 TaxID=3050073 RepID=UPI002ACC57D1|nr:hypothetical protein [Halorubrum sp. AD140]MDZ5810548.1 hypothetical protein [Halorubrum sp. AD140]
MINWSPIVSSVGIALVLIGTLVLALPDLPRFLRIRYYKNSRLLRDYYEAREYVLSAKRGRRFTFEDYVICYTFIDYLDMNYRSDIPDNTPEKIETGAVTIRAKEEDGWNEYDFQMPQRSIVELLDLTLERECRISGIAIALIGTLLAIIGVLL